MIFLGPGASTVLVELAAKHTNPVGFAFVMLLAVITSAVVVYLRMRNRRR